MKIIVLENRKLFLGIADVLDKSHLGYLVVINKQCIIYENDIVHSNTTVFASNM